MRAHAHVEEHIGRLKDSGLLRFPFSNLEANRTWLLVVAGAADLVRWFQLLCLDGALAQGPAQDTALELPPRAGTTRPQRTREIVRILDGWPSADALIGAYTKMAALC